MLPIGLKGADLVVYSVLESLGMKVKVLPVLKHGERRGGKIVGKKLWGSRMEDREVDEDMGDDELDEVSIELTGP